MQPEFRRSLFIFRRDLRLEDNTALLAASERSMRVSLLFILDPRQIQAHPYRSGAGLQFMLRSLRELAQSVETKGAALRFLRGAAEEELAKLLANEQFDAVFFNRDYTPFSRERDKAMRMCAEVHGASIHQYGDCLLHEPETVKKEDGTPYTVFTPFMKRASSHAVRAPNRSIPSNLEAGSFGISIHEALDSLGAAGPAQPFRFGGRKEALSILARVSGFLHYDQERDFPARQATTGLSPHHKFGTVSVREVYHAIAAALGPTHTLIRELWWRDFFSHIAFHFPHVFRGAFHRHFDSLPWHENADFLARWRSGETGFPIVDAGMRELNTTGFMHNRVRMIVASFLTKDLLLSWREGERYFAERLLDYDPAVNNGNWQWASSTGCDAQPYFRIFNPWRQQKRFDPQCEYIKRWVPELAHLSHSEIHAWGDAGAAAAAYPRPVVEHARQKRIAEDLYAQAAKRAKITVVD